jgi:hypothetical protein
VTAPRALPLGLALALVGCEGALTPADPLDGDAGPTSDAPIWFDDLDKARAQERFQVTGDLMRYVIAPGCAANRNECHSNEDFPDMSTEGNLWNLADLLCNQGVGDPLEVEDFCEALGDELRITAGANEGFVARVGSISTLEDDEGRFERYEIFLEAAPPMDQANAGFQFLRDGVAMASLGGGASLQVIGASKIVSVTNANHLVDPDRVRQGDRNQNGVFGDGGGVLVRPGDARGSYLVRRVLGQGTERVRMPLPSDNVRPKFNRNLSPDEVYALMSWINCMDLAKGIYAPIDYDCAANADNEGRW